VKVGLLALQGASAAHGRVFRRLGVETVDVRTPEALSAIDLIVLPGGESTTISMMLEANGLLEPLRACLRDGLAAFGTCAGMILLASDVLDGRPDQHQLDAIDISVRRNAFGRQVDSFEADLAVQGLDGGPMPAVFIRAPVVERVGPAVEVLARVDDRPVVCRQGRVTVAAFHPELSDDDRLHRMVLANARND
jgi:5'-phosphate synthase pdxT subunit